MREDERTSASRLDACATSPLSAHATSRAQRHPLTSWKALRAPYTQSGLAVISALTETCTESVPWGHVAVVAGTPPTR